LAAGLCPDLLGEITAFSTHLAGFKGGPTGEEWDGKEWMEGER